MVQRGYFAGIIAITSPVTGSIFRTGDAAPCDPKRILSSARLYSVAALCLYFAQPPGRACLFFEEVKNLLRRGKDELHSTAAWRAGCRRGPDASCDSLLACRFKVPCEGSSCTDIGNLSAQQINPFLCH